MSPYNPPKAAALSAILLLSGCGIRNLDYKCGILKSEDRTGIVRYVDMRKLDFHGNGVDDNDEIIFPDNRTIKAENSPEARKRFEYIIDEFNSCKN